MQSQIRSAIQTQQLSQLASEPLYIPLQGKHTQFEAEQAEDLAEVVNRFLEFGDSKRVLLLRGDAGSGKSVFCQELVRKLWQEAKEDSPTPL